MADSTFAASNTVQTDAVQIDPNLEIDESARQMLSPLLREQITELIRVARRRASTHGLSIQNMTLTGFASFEEASREVILTCWLGTLDDAADALLDELAHTVATLNQSAGSHEDPHATRLAVAVRQDA